MLMEQICSGAGLDAFHTDDGDERGMQLSDEERLIVSRWVLNRTEGKVELFERRLHQSGSCWCNVRALRGICSL